MANNIIEVTNLTKTYKMYQKPVDRLKESLSITRKVYGEDFYALNNVSFTVEKGENIGIIGTNGSGKSTILKIITGVLSASQGNVQVNGKIAALLELGAGFNMEYSGMENIYLNGTMMGFSKEQMEEKVESILTFAGIGDFVHQPVKTYSSGMFARLAFAVAINVEPDILIVDEALSVGDTRFQLKCMEKMKKMMSGGTTVLFVSHDINAIKRFCTRAIWLKQGVAMGDGDVNEITDMYLDYLKEGDMEYEDSSEETNTYRMRKEKVVELRLVTLKDMQGNELQKIVLDEKLNVEVQYEVYDEDVDEPVLGLALFSIDGDCVCSFNTKKDHMEIPWVRGMNTITLAYTHGIRALGGKYYFAVTLMDDDGENICYREKIREFVISAGYLGEGKLIIPHQWIPVIEGK